MSQSVESVPLHQATADRYLSYALSVITSRALPDVRDGLKPVQRRILYTMYADMGLVPSARYRKCAGVVGEVMGKYHPHGDQSIYDALVRMAQDFSLRAPLVDGQGNFGSLDGDPPAAMRYTECRLQPIAEELLSEIRKQTVDFRPNYDGQRSEPVVLPAQLPHLLVNGSEGIAVGMATRIPPHNLGEIVDAAVALIDDRTRTVRDLLKFVQGPDFPTGGRVLATPEELAAVYETGQGTLKVRATWSEVADGKRRQVIVDSVPFGQNKSKIVEHIGEEVRLRRLPQVVDVRDESTDEVRVVLDLAPGASAEVVMAYLFKRTDLQTTWAVNLTALVPVPGSDVPSPARLDLKQMLEYWLDFRLATVRRRYEYDLEQLRQRIHILEGFALVFDGLDDAIRIIRASAGRAEAAEGLIARFGLTEIQADAVLDLRLYRLAQLEIEAIREELAEKREEAARIEKILGSERKLWGEVRKELESQRKHHASARRTSLGEAGPALTFDEDAYMVSEETYVVVSRDGWVKRQSSYSGLDKVRLRDGDGVAWLVRADTRSTMTFFTNRGGAYVLRVGTIPQTTGHGEPVQAMFTFEDGEVVVGVSSDDERNRIWPRPPANPDDPPTPFAVAVTAGGRGLRFSLAAHAEVSNRTGRRFARLTERDQVVAVWGLPGVDDRVHVTTSAGRTVQIAACEVPVVRNAGKGAEVVDLEEGERVVAFVLGDEPAPIAAGRWARAPVVWDQDREPIDPATLAPYRELQRIVVTPEEREAAKAAREAARAEREAAKAAALIEKAERAAAKELAREAAAREKEAQAEARRIAAAEREAAREAAAAEKAALAAQKQAEREEEARAKAAAREAAAAEKAALAAQKQAERDAAAAEKAAIAAAAAEARDAARREKEAIAAQKQAERDAAAAEKAQRAADKEAARLAAEQEKARRAAEKQAAAAEKEALAEARRVAAAEKEAARLAAEQERAERAAAKEAAREEAAREKAAREAEKQAAAEAREAAAREKAALAAQKQAEREAAAAEKAAQAEARRVAAAEKEAAREAAAREKAQRAAEKQAAAEAKEAAKREKQALDDARRAARDAALIERERAAKQAAADALAAGRTRRRPRTDDDDE